MNSGSVLTLLNPALSLIFSAAFLLLWRYKRDLNYLAWIALAYFTSAAGFLLQLHVLPIGLEPTRMMSNVLLMVGVVAMSAGVILRYAQTVPWRLLGVISIVALGAVAWFMFVDPDITWRIYAMNFAAGAILLITAAKIWAAPNRALVDNVLLGLFLFNGTSFFVRTLVTLYIDTQITSTEALHGSLYWIVFTFTHAVISLVVTFTLITAVVLDIIGDLKTETETDPLSGLLNRRGFELAAKAALKEAPALPVSLFVADLDHFKSINDTHGHHIGDKVISSFASVLRQILADGHLIGRIGGEEFAVMMRGAKLETAKLAAEGVRVAFSIAPTPGRALGASRRLTASFGVAECLPGEPYAELLARADVALYQAKRAGRDCVRVAVPPQDSPPRVISPVKSRAQL